MGGTESRFNTLLVEGNESDALGLWHSYPDLQERFRPEVPIKSSPHRDKPLHACARSGMKVLMHEFLERGADPHARNANEETALHLVCRSARFSSRTNAHRAELLRLLLDKIANASEEPSDELSNGTEWFSQTTPSAGLEKKLDTRALTLERPRSSSNVGSSVMDPYNLGVEDKNRNTPLHLASASGLLSCVEVRREKDGLMGLLLAHKAPLFVFNIAGQTPCDVAAESKQLIIAKLLESKMVFTPQGDSGEGSKGRIMSRSRIRSFHNTQSLSKLRNDIVHQMAEHLKITEFSSQALLMAYGWSEDLVKEAWAQDRAGACQKAGLDPDAVALDGDGDMMSPMLMSLSMKQCEICFCDFTPDQMVQIPCSHRFCVECWKSYLQCEIEQGLGKEIRCPGHACYKIVPTEVVSDLVPDHLFKKYASLNLKMFVDNYSSVKWCPYPDCESAVSLKEGGGARGGTKTDREMLQLRLGINVECCHGHGFCWHCMKEPHEPCSCDLWQKWKEVIGTMGDVDGTVAKASREAAANARWIVSFTKPCPNCSAPIQKNEGCNHMTCRKCYYDFCWVCLDPWHLHSHKTGGYFTCNRFKQQQQADKEVRKARKDILEDYMKAAEEDKVSRLERFTHYHSRYSNHLNSLEIELKLLQDSQKKTKELKKLGQVLEKKVAAARKETQLPDQEETDGATGMQTETNFLDDVIRVLLNARRILSASYCIGYFIPPENREQIMAHETLQGKLEEVVEMLAQVVNRPYLSTPHDRISETARNVDYLCEEYLMEMREVAKAAARHSLKVTEKRPPRRLKQRTPPPNPPPPLRHHTPPPPLPPRPPRVDEDQLLQQALAELWYNSLQQRRQ